MKKKVIGVSVAVIVVAGLSIYLLNKNDNSEKAALVNNISEEKKVAVNKIDDNKNVAASNLDVPNSSVDYNKKSDEILEKLKQVYSDEEIKRLQTYTGFENKEVRSLYFELLLKLAEQKVNFDDIQNQISEKTTANGNRLPSEDEIVEMYPENTRDIVRAINQKLRESRK